MTNINCTADCIYQKEGKCTLYNISEATKIDNNIGNDSNNKNTTIDCPYYRKKKQQF
ncbi:hypothetical protein TKV_c06030 [Thermoanaerobacter kivui]|uniref:DUF1540 domain-containing protein n=1 Tax=Thermoanaerobacter kivui TaxID=2325 RepID=A0A097APP7_THEKI|nr:hypothetical protein [Thermoanaerobacter kivui]AIS51799.1 hypothetical protein TKV_c06030 [Thermoanaerobacter kivui]